MNEKYTTPFEILNIWMKHLNDENLNLQECRDKFEAEHGWSALHIFDEVFEGAEILKLNGHKW